jgi:hypothetical protein
MGRSWEMEMAWGEDVGSKGRDGRAWNVSTFLVLGRKLNTGEL